MSYKPKFKTTLRNGKKAIWVKLPNKNVVNIWDLPKEQLTEGVKDAIAVAFERGMQAGIQLSAPRDFDSVLGRDSWGK